MNAPPPKLKASSAWLVGIFLALMVAGIGILVFFFNPTTNHFYPVCQFHALTGLNCPGCGMTRAFYALLHGNFSTAMRDNALLVLALAGLAVRRVWFAVKKLGGRPGGEFFPAKFLWPLLGVALVFTVLRNLPAFTFLAP